MKILTTGLLVFVAWSAVSTYFYVCKIKDLCKDQIQPTEIVVKKPPPKAPEKLSVTAPDSLVLHFEYNATIFIPNDKLADYVSIAKEYMEQEPDKTMYVIGNTDAIGSEAYNETLGMKRANNVNGFFIKSGIDKARIILHSNSKNKPVATNNTEDGRAMNRRVKIDIK